MNGLFQAVCRTGIFMICAQALVHFRPQESYEKYLKLLVSVLVLIQLFLPIGGLFVGADGETASDRLEEFRVSLQQSMEEARLQAAEQEALLEQMTLEEVRRRMEEQQAVLEQQGEQEEQGEQLSLPEAGTEQSQVEIKIEIEPVEPIMGNSEGRDERHGY